MEVTDSNLGTCWGYNICHVSKLEKNGLKFVYMLSLNILGDDELQGY